MSFLVRRLAFYLVAAWVALTANFFIPRAMPGNAVQSIMDKFPNLQPSAYKAIEAMLGVGNQARSGTSTRPTWTMWLTSTSALT